MCVDADKVATLLRAFGRAVPPNGIRQEAFEHDDRHLRHLARLRPGDRPEVKDIWEYTQDLLYRSKSSRQKNSASPPPCR